MTPQTSRPDPIRSREAIRHRLLGNIRTHAFARSANLVVGIVLLPYVLAHLTRDQYGLWAWVMSLSGYLSLADLGISQGNIPAFARALAENRPREIGRTLTATLTLHVAAALAAAALLFALRAPATRALGGTSGAPAITVLFLLIAANGASLCANPFTSLLNAMQRFDLVQKVQLARLAAYVVGTVAVLESGGGLFALGLLQLALESGQTAAQAALCVALFPRLRPVLPRIEDLRSRLGAGAPLLLLSLLGAIAHGFERAILGFFADLSLVAQYAVASRLATLARELPHVMLYSTIPASAALHAAKDEAALRRLYLRSFKMTAAAVLPTVVTIWVCGPSLLHAWLGAGFDAAGRIARPLAVGILATALCSPGVNVLIGKAQLDRVHRLFAGWIAASIVVNLGWLWLTGGRGAGWGLMAVNTAGIARFLSLYHAGEISFRSPAWLSIRRAAFGACLAGAFAAFVLTVCNRFLLPPTRVGSFLAVALAASALWGSYATWAWRSGFLSPEDRTLLREAVLCIRRRSEENSSSIDLAEPVQGKSSAP